MTERLTTGNQEMLAHLKISHCNLLFLTSEEFSGAFNIFPSCLMIWFWNVGFQENGWMESQSKKCETWQRFQVIHLKQKNGSFAAQVGSNWVLQLSKWNLHSCPLLVLVCTSPPASPDWLSWSRMLPGTHHSNNKHHLSQHYHRHHHHHPHHLLQH